MSQGTPINSLKKDNTLVNDIISDYNSKQGGNQPVQYVPNVPQPVQPPQYDPTPPQPEEEQYVQENMVNPEQEEEYYDYDPKTYDQPEPYVPTIFDELKPVALFFVLFVVLNYMPIVTLLDNIIVNINIPYLSLIIRAIIGAILFFFIKKFI